MSTNTSKKIKLNFIFSVIAQAVSLLVGIIVPRLFIINYGSEANGYINSINQIFVYVALLEGELKRDFGKIETFISRSTKNRTQMAVASSGRRAVTNYRVIERSNGYTFCEFSLETGRTHQIRVHAKHLGHPIVGDTVYGYKNQKFKLNGQLLHAKRLTFIHPTTGSEVSFEAQLPTYFLSVLKKLGFTKI